jgi:hypothetical protein
MDVSRWTGWMFLVGWDGCSSLDGMDVPRWTGWMFLAGRDGCFSLDGMDVSRWTGWMFLVGWDEWTVDQTLDKGMLQHAFLL